MNKSKQSHPSNNEDFKVLKFRSFASKEQEGFIMIFDHQIPEDILQDLLFQLFQPIFSELSCPEIYYFSSTDQILSYDDVISMKDYIYIHFLQRVKQYQKHGKYSKKLNIGNINELSKGVNFNGFNLYIISEKYYLMYNHEFFYKNVDKKIDSLPLQVERKQIKYGQYSNQIINLKDNHEMSQLKQEISEMVDQTSSKLRNLQDINNRYVIASTTLKNILKESGIKILGVKDLY